LRSSAKSYLFLLVLFSFAIAHASPSPSSNKAALLAGADLPHYPIIAKVAGVTGRLWLRITVKEGHVVGAEVIKSEVRNKQHLLLSVPDLLAIPTIENLKTWRFADYVTGELVVTYTYRLAGTATTGQMNPEVVVSPSLDVMITARPVKPLVTY
jgi:hypothetical protein